MRSGRRSRTAEGAAAMRAMHQSFDAEPRVLEDPFAAPLLFPEIQPLLERSRKAPGLRRSQLVRRVYPWSRTPTGPRRMRAQVVVRSRYAEDQLATALGEGVDQYVVLAAGLDSFALRRPDTADFLTVFEVDHPESQEFKRQRMAALARPLPPNLELVPIDFERQRLPEALEQSGYQATRPVFCSWLGVTYYLTHEAILDTLRFLAEQAPGSRMVLDYWSLATSRGFADRVLLEATRLSVAGEGEPMKSFFDPDQMRQAIEESGLQLIENLGPRGANERYLGGRRDGLLMPGFAHLALVRVPDRGKDPQPR